MAQTRLVGERRVSNSRFICNVNRFGAMRAPVLIRAIYREINVTSHRQQQRRYGGDARRRRRPEQRTPLSKPVHRIGSDSSATHQRLGPAAEHLVTTTRAPDGLQCIGVVR
jgi:hypothetical protein